MKATLIALSALLWAAQAQANEVIKFKQYAGGVGNSVSYFVALDDNGVVYHNPAGDAACNMTVCGRPPTPQPIVDVVRYDPQGGETILYALSEGGELWRAPVTDCSGWSYLCTFPFPGPFAGFGVKTNRHGYVVTRDGTVYSGFWAESGNCNIVYCGQWSLATAVGDDPPGTVTEATWGHIKGMHE